MNLKSKLNRYDHLSKENEKVMLQLGIALNYVTDPLMAIENSMNYRDFLIQNNIQFEKGFENIQNFFQQSSMFLFSRTV
jgi:hypothetical protein